MSPVVVRCNTCGSEWEVTNLPVGVAIPLCMHCAKRSLASNEVSPPAPEPDAAA